MRTSHREIRKRILEEKSKISDEEFFTSKAYRGYLTDLAEAATKRYNRPLKVTIVAEHDNDQLAFTDFNGIFINACNEITWSMPSRRLRSLSIEGLVAHENGHNLFTDNRIWMSFHKKLEQGKFYPNTPTGLDGLQKLHAKEILEAMQDSTDDIPRMVISSTAKAYLHDDFCISLIESLASFALLSPIQLGITMTNWGLCKILMATPWSSMAQQTQL